MLQPRFKEHLAHRAFVHADTAGSSGHLPPGGSAVMLLRVSPDEVFAAVVCSILSLIAWGRWYGLLITIRSPAGAPARRWLLALAPVLAGVVLFLMLVKWAAGDVRDDGKYLLFYVIFGLAWVGIFRAPFALLGLSWQGDALARGNSASVFALTGAILGLMACFAGANIGDGPGWWCVAVAGGLATLAWYVAWAILDRLGGIGEAVAVERDAAAGLRLGGFLFAAGIICGRGAAGDWHSAAATVREFADAWPLLPLLAVAIVSERIFAIRRGALPPGLALAGVAPAVVELTVAVLLVHGIGAPAMGGTLVPR